MEYLLTKGTAYYFATTLFLALLGVFILLRHLSFLEKIRKKRLSKIKSSDLLASHINKNVDPTKIKQQRLNSLKNCFIITKRTLYVAIVFVVLLAVLIPLTGNLSPTFKLRNG